MTTRKIVIKDCEDCPSLDHKGAFGKLSRIPVCRKANKELPLDPAVSEITSRLAPNNFQSSLKEPVDGPSYRFAMGTYQTDRRGV